MSAKPKPKTDSRLMSFEEAAQICGLHPNTIRQRKAGTEELTHVSGFGRRVHLVRAEVLDLVDRKIAEAQAEHRKQRNGLYAIK